MAEKEAAVEEEAAVEAAAAVEEAPEEEAAAAAAVFRRRAALTPWTVRGSPASILWITVDARVCVAAHMVHGLDPLARFNMCYGFKML